jgi:hypothetical protein
MSEAEVCERLTKASALDSTKKAIAILWHIDSLTPGKPMSAYALAKIMSEHRLGNPNRSVLTKGLDASPLTMKKGSGFVLRNGAAREVEDWLSDVMDIAPVIDHSSGYLPEPLWTKTRGYIEKVCVQLNGSYKYGFYDAASVMLRRLIETLIIECYEHLHREEEIKNPQGHYSMLGDLVDAALGGKGLNLGAREVKIALTGVKKLGDRAAHNRRFNAIRPDLDSLKDDVRVGTDVLINIAALRHN